MEPLEQENLSVSKMKINQFTHTKKLQNKVKNTKNQKIMIYMSLELMKIKFLQKIKNKKKRKILQKKRTRNSKKNNKTYEKLNKVKSDFEMVSQSQKDILNNFYNYENIFDKKNESKKQDLNKFIDSEIENKTQKNSKKKFKKK